MPPGIHITLDCTTSLQGHVDTLTPHVVNSGRNSGAAAEQLPMNSASHNSHNSCAHDQRSEPTLRDVIELRSKWSSGAICTMLINIVE
jgi:hypothetical protein